MQHSFTGFMQHSFTGFMQHSFKGFSAICVNPPPHFTVIQMLQDLIQKSFESSASQS